MRLLKEKYDGLQEIGNLSDGLKRFLSEPDIQQALQKSDFSMIYEKVHIQLASDFTQLMNSLNIDPLEHLNYIPNYFLADTTIKSITIPTYIKRIGSAAFQNCVHLAHITIPDSVIDIGTEAFAYCKGLTSVTIPDSVTIIGGSAFSRCSRLTSITIPDNVTSIGSSAFKECAGLTSIVIPGNVMDIGELAFFWCEGLTNVTIGNNVTSIGDEAFYGCSNLISINYMGAKSQWYKINLSTSWNEHSPIKTIHCTDGDITL